MSKVDRLTVKLPMYYAQIEFYICDDYGVLAKAVPERIREDVLESTSSGTFSPYTMQDVKLYRRPIIYARWHNIPIIAHEILHACTWIASQSGIPMTYENDETLAYMQQYLLNIYLAKFWDIK